METVPSVGHLDQRIMRLMNQDIGTLISQLCNLSLALTGSSINGAADMALQVVVKVEGLVEDMKVLGTSAQELLDANRQPPKESLEIKVSVVTGDEEGIPFDDGQRN